MRRCIALSSTLPNLIKYSWRTLLWSTLWPIRKWLILVGGRRRSWAPWPPSIKAQIGLLTEPIWTIRIWRILLGRMRWRPRRCVKRIGVISNSILDGVTALWLPEKCMTAQSEPNWNLYLQGRSRRRADMQKEKYSWWIMKSWRIRWPIIGIQFRSWRSKKKKKILNRRWLRAWPGLFARNSSRGWVRKWKTLKKRSAIWTLKKDCPITLTSPQNSAYHIRPSPCQATLKTSSKNILWNS